MTGKPKRLSNKEIDEIIDLMSWAISESNSLKIAEQYKRLIPRLGKFKN